MPAWQRAKAPPLAPLFMKAPLKKDLPGVKRL